MNINLSFLRSRNVQFSASKLFFTYPIRWLLAAMMTILVVLPSFAASQGYLLVDSYSNLNIVRYNLATGAFVDELVPQGTGGMERPMGMKIGPDGNLYVADAGLNARVLKFDAHNGEFLGTFASVSGPSSLFGLGFGPDGNLYVSDIATNTVHRFDGSTGSAMGTFASINIPNDAIRDIAWGPDGNLYVAMLLSGTVARLDGHTGALIDTFGSPETGDAHQLSFGPDGLLYVSEHFGSSNSVDIYDPIAGLFVKSLDSPYLSGADSMVFDDNGILYVNSLFSSTIVRFSGEQGVLLAQGGPLNNPIEMVITPVPEPETYATLLAGLGLLGFVVRRRKEMAT